MKKLENTSNTSSAKEWNMLPVQNHSLMPMKITAAHPNPILNFHNHIFIHVQLHICKHTHTHTHKRPRIHTEGSTISSWLMRSSMCSSTGAHTYAHMLTSLHQCDFLTNVLIFFYANSNYLLTCMSSWLYSVGWAQTGTCKYFIAHISGAGTAA